MRVLTTYNYSKFKMRLDSEEDKVYSKFEIQHLSLFVNAFYLLSVKSSWSIVKSKNLSSKYSFLAWTQLILFSCYLLFSNP